MDLKTIHTEIAHHWIRINGISDQLKKVLSGFEGNNLFGYVYIDHTAGVTLEVVKLFDVENGEIIYKDSPSDKSTRIIARLEGIINSEEIQLLPNELIEELHLEVPEYLASYEKPELDEFRLDDSFHEFRGDGFPDDVQILLPPIKGFQPELIWGRVEKHENDQLTCQLLNQPHQDFGIQIYDLLHVSIQTIEGDKYLVCEIETKENSETKTTKTNKKPWWKF